MPCHATREYIIEKVTQNGNGELLSGKNVVVYMVGKVGTKRQKR